MYTSMSEHNRLVNQYLKVFFVVALYWTVSICTVFMNKLLLSSDTVNLDAPLFVCWFQCLLTAVLCAFLSALGRRYPSIISFPEGNPFDLDIFRKILPLSILFTLMVATNNLCLKYVGVAFYYVGRSLTTVFNVVLTYVLLRQKTSFKAIICCVFVVFGFLLGVDQESITTQFSLRGTIYGVLGSLILAWYSIQTKKALVHVHQEVLLLSYYNNVYSSLFFLPLILINGEVNTIVGYENLFAPWFISAMLIGGLCGFAIGFVTVLQIKVTSPLSHNISGTAKACAQTIIATQWYNDTKSALWWMSNLIVLLASAAYTRVKQLEMQRQHERNSATQKA
ncbi:GDP-fucose transporter 1 [Anastrepha obliqua]|uniref:GDP-fucose transporter 1 n=1 Tax=Anastrepha obliqua TaxID=95512 RepID=UPI002409AB06|nr:GDP-fucose transporter 1 [Anastrepha obliqua]